MGLPISRVMSRASSSLRSVIISKALRRISPRWRGGCFAQSAWASTAASSAASESSGCASATSQRLSPVAGSSTASVPPSLASRHSPPIKSCFFTLSITVRSEVSVLMSLLRVVPLPTDYHDYTHALRPQSLPTAVAGYNRRAYERETKQGERPPRSPARSGGEGAREGLRPRRGDGRRTANGGRRASQGVAGSRDGRRHGLHAPSGRAPFKSAPPTEERPERSISGGFVLSGRAPRESGGWGPGRPLRLGTGLSPRHKRASARVAGGTGRGSRVQDQGAGVHGRGALAGAVGGPARGAGILRAQLMPHQPEYGLVLLYRGPDFGSGDRAGRARHGHLRQVHPLHVHLPDRRDKGPRRGGCEAVHLVPDHREQGRDPPRAAPRGGRLGLWLRRLPGGLPVQQTQGNA